jgi:hypothetical protein
MKTYEIYYADLDFPCETGDPCLGTVEANTREDAECIATERGLGGVAGALAIERAKLRTRKQADK